MATDITTDRLCELAETHSAAGKVLSVFINLDPREFAAPPARATEISSVLDEASRAIRDLDTLTHAERVALNADVERVRDALANGLDAEGARGLAVFASQPAGLFQIHKLPRPVAHKVSIGDSPCVEPLGDIPRRVVAGGDLLRLPQDPLPGGHVVVEPLPRRGRGLVDEPGGGRPVLVAAREVQGVRLVDPGPVVCPGGTCPAARDGMVVFRDTAHLSATYALTLADWLEERIGEIPSHGSGGAG